MFNKSFVITLLLAKCQAFKLEQRSSTPTKYAKDDQGLPHIDAGGNYNPGASTMDPNGKVWQRTAIHDGKVHGEKQHQENANDLQAYGAKQEDVANARLPYASTLVQLQADQAKASIPSGYAKDDQGLPWIDAKGNYNPGASAMDPNGKVWQRVSIHDGKVHGEKQHQENANDLQEYGAKQEDVANARLPYASTLLQLGGAPSIPSGYAKDDQGLPWIDASGAYNPGASKMDPNAKVWQRATIHDAKVHGEKQWQEWANDMQEYGAKQELVANTRIPYASTLLQLGGAPAIPSGYAKDDQGLPWIDAKGNYNPGASTMDPNGKVWQRVSIHDGKVHGEKQHQENANDLQEYGAKQEDVANARIPYASTLLQLQADQAKAATIPGAYAKDDQGLPWIDGSGAYNPGASTMDPNGKVWQRVTIHDAKVHGEKQWQAWANDLQEYGAKQEDVANARLPYASTLVQLGGAPAIPSGYAKDDQGLPWIDAKGNYNPGASTMDPNGKVWQRTSIHDGKVHGEKQHQENANDLQAYGAKQEDVANARLPYASTLIQLQADQAKASIPSAYAKDDQGLPWIDGSGAYNPGASSMDPNGKVWQRTSIHDGKVHGEKQHQENANDLQEYGAKQEDVANARIPYASTLIQLRADQAKASIPSAYAKDDQGLPWIDGSGAYNPGASSMDPNGKVWQRTSIHDGKVHGEKQHQENANDLQEYGAKQEDVANARIPYASTLLQTNEPKFGTGEAGETFEMLGQVPINYQFNQLKDDYYVDEDYDNDGEPETLEISSDVPHDFKFIHIQTSEGELMKEEPAVNLIETMATGAERDIPLNFGFVHLQNQDGDDIMRYI